MTPYFQLEKKVSAVNYRLTSNMKRFESQIPIRYKCCKSYLPDSSTCDYVTFSQTVPQTEDRKDVDNLQLAVNITIITLLSSRKVSGLEKSF